MGIGTPLPMGSFSLMSKANSATKYAVHALCKVHGNSTAAAHAQKRCIQFSYALSESTHLRTTNVSLCLSKVHEQQPMHCLAANACHDIQHDMQVVVKSSPAFHLFYATGWQEAVVHMRVNLPLGEPPQVTFLFCHTMRQHTPSLVLFIACS